jgi:hypothetical protein
MSDYLGSGLTIGGMGLAPYGLRHSGEGAKGLGYFGALPSQDGFSTEISTDFEQNGKTVEMPLMVPTLNPVELQRLLSGGEPTEDIYEKARSHAAMRMLQGLSPFAGPNDLRWRMPIPSMLNVNGQMPQRINTGGALQPMLIGSRG